MYVNDSFSLKSISHIIFIGSSRNAPMVVQSLNYMLLYIVQYDIHYDECATDEHFA